MSTTFGKTIINENGDEETINIAFRWGCKGGVGMKWLNPLAQFLPDSFEVEALDNSHQGIYTIGDIKKAIEQFKATCLIEEAVAKGIKIGSVIDRRHFGLESMTHDIVRLTPHIDTAEDSFKYNEINDELWFSNRLVYYKGVWCKIYTGEETFDSYDKYIPIFDAMQ